MGLKSKLLKDVRYRQLVIDDAELPDMDSDLAYRQDSANRPGRTVETDVTRVVHSGLIMRPIFELDARRLRQSDTGDFSEAWADLDVIWLTFAMLDVVSELTEYQVGATREEVIKIVLPHARRQADTSEKELTDDGIKEALNKIFDHLVNRENRYLPFEYSYFDAGAGSFQKRRFWLIKNVFTGESGPSLFTLTDEGYTAYFGLLETGALDAAAIGNLRIRMLIERGNVDDAIGVARQNRKQCIRKSHEVRRERRKIRNNIRLVDFKALMTLADEGAQQATHIQKESGRLHRMVLDNLMNMDLKHRRSRMHVLADALGDLNQHLMDLSRELQRLPDDYHAYVHKLFGKRSSGILPRVDEVLKRVCRMAQADGAKVGERFLAGFDPPMLRPLFDPAGIILSCDRALERRITPGDHRQPIQEIEGESIQRHEPQLTPELMHRAYSEIIAEIRKAGSIALSRLLKQMSQKGETLLPVAIAMAIFQSAADRRIGKKHGSGWNSRCRRSALP
jgi:hypothetical protein